MIYTATEVRKFDQALRDFGATDTMASEHIHDIVGKWIYSIYVGGYHDDILLRIEHSIQDQDIELRDELEIIFYSCLSKALN